MKEPRRLTVLEAKFVREFMVDGNASRACLRAGYTDKGEGGKLLRRPHVRSAIDAARTKVFQAIDVTAESVLKEMAAVGFGDMATFMKRLPGDSELPGELVVDLSDLPEGATKLIEEIIEEPIIRGRGEDAVRVGTKRRIKLYSKLSALMKLGEHVKLWGGARGGAAGGAGPDAGPDHIPVEERIKRYAASEQQRAATEGAKGHGAEIIPIADRAARVPGQPNGPRARSADGTYDGTRQDSDPGRRDGTRGTATQATGTHGTHVRDTRQPTRARTGDAGTRDPFDTWGA